MRHKYPWLGLAILQTLGILCVLVYALNNPLVPGQGLDQLDAFTLHEKVEGLAAPNHMPTLILAPGNLKDPACQARLKTYIAQFGAKGGLNDAYNLVVLINNGYQLPLNQASVIMDTQGRLASRLALPSATTMCKPGYAVMDGQGYVRYRTYDQNSQRHTQEQNILLESLAKGHM